MLKVHIKKLRDVAVLCVEGQIVRGEGLSTLRNVAVSQARPGIMILDLASVDIIDAGGIGCFAGIARVGSEKRNRVQTREPKRTRGKRIADYTSGFRLRRVI